MPIPPSLPAGRIEQPHRRKLRVGLIGAGAFGAFCLPHLSHVAQVKVCDPHSDLNELCAGHNAEATDLPTAAAQDVIVLAVPFGQLREVAKAVAPHVREGSLVIDVCSIKTKPLAILMEELPPAVDIVGTHPLFGPQSGRDGIEGLRIAVCQARGRRAPVVERFLRDRFGLAVMRTSAEEHDRQMAYVQGLTHLVARIATAMDIPPVDHTTQTYSHLQAMIGMVRHDSQELFRTIMADNPFAESMAQSFVRAANDVLQPFHYPTNNDVLSELR